MHRCLIQAIDNAEAAVHEDPTAEYVRHGLRDPEHVGYMASDTQMTSDEVYLHLREVDMWDNTSRNLHAALDEGCNTTCHSEAWASGRKQIEGIWGGHAMDLKAGEVVLRAWSKHQDPLSTHHSCCIVAQRRRGCARDDGQSSDHGSSEDTIALVIVCTSLVRTYQEHEERHCHDGIE